MAEGVLGMRVVGAFPQPLPGRKGTQKGARVAAVLGPPVLTRESFEILERSVGSLECVVRDGMIAEEGFVAEGGDVLAEGAGGTREGLGVLEGAAPGWLG